MLPVIVVEIVAAWLVLFAWRVWCSAKRWKRLKRHTEEWMAIMCRAEQKDIPDLYMAYMGELHARPYTHDSVGRCYPRMLVRRDSYVDGRRVSGVHHACADHDARRLGGRGYGGAKD